MFKKSNKLTILKIINIPFIKILINLVSMQKKED